MQDVPGDIVECGVFRGSGVYTWVKLLCLFKANTEQRVVAFDFFETSREVEFRSAIDKECLEAMPMDLTGGSHRQLQGVGLRALKADCR